MRPPLRRLSLTAAAALFAAAAAWPQWSFNLDTTFRTEVVDQNVNSLALMANEQLLISGRIRFPGDMSIRGSARLNADGSRDLSFTDFNGQGKLTPWMNKFYVAIGATVRRLNGDGYLDQSYIGSNSGPYFLSGSGGDYHVFPDGRVLLSGTHILSDSIRGFVGAYELIWFTNTGYLDTTRVHRQANGPIWGFKELPNGKFICSCSCTQYEGQPVSRLFRVHADGALDTTFQTGVNWGNNFAYHPLPDGRVYAGGRYKRANAPNDTLFLARFLPDGSLDPTFTPPSITMGGLAADYGPLITWLQPWPGGHLIAAGEFGSVNQMSRESIFMVDSTGALTAAFDNFHVGIYQGQFGANASINWTTSVSTDTLYICGAYIGLNDGTTNDPQQRFVSRLLVSELTVGVEQRAMPGMRVYPNPASTTATLELDVLPPHTQLVLRDALGREVLRRRVHAHTNVLNLQALPDGIYTLELREDHKRISVQRLAVRH